MTEKGFAELDPDDKKEFAGVQEAINAQNAKRCFQQWNVERLAKRRRMLDVLVGKD